MVRNLVMAFTVLKTRGRINNFFLVEIRNERIDVARARTLGHNSSFPRVLHLTPIRPTTTRFLAVLSYAMCDEICRWMMEAVV